MTERHDPGFSRPFTAREHVGIPVLREVEEYGVIRLVLMEKVSVIRRYPAWREFKIGPIIAHPNGVSEITSDIIDHPAEEWGESHWRPAIRRY